MSNYTNPIGQTPQRSRFIWCDHNLRAAMRGSKSLLDGSYITVSDRHKFGGFESHWTSDEEFRIMCGYTHETEFSESQVLEYYEEEAYFMWQAFMYSLAEYYTQFINEGDIVTFVTVERTERLLTEDLA